MMFETHDDSRYDMPSSVSGPYMKYWDSVSFHVNSYVFMVTYIIGSGDDSEIGNVMVASTDLVKSSLNSEYWDVIQLTILARHDNSRTEWSSYNLTMLEVDERKYDDTDEGVYECSTFRLTTDNGDALYIVDELVTTNPHEGDFVKVFVLNKSFDERGKSTE